MANLVTCKSMMPLVFAEACGRALEMELRAETIVFVHIVVKSNLEVGWFHL
jgi:hypothetical protein